MKAVVDTITPWMATDDKTVFAQFTKVWTSEKKTVIKKMLIPQLAIYTEFFHCTFANAVYALLRNWQLGA